MGIIWSLIIGGGIGWLAGLIVGRDIPGGIIGNIIAGFIGGWLGGVILGEMGPEIGGFYIIPALIGAIVPTNIFTPAVNATIPKEAVKVPLTTSAKGFLCTNNPIMAMIPSRTGGFFKI